MKMRLPFLALCLAGIHSFDLSAESTDLHSLLEVKKSIQQTSTEITRLRDEIASSETLREEEKQKLLHVVASQNEEISQLRNYLSQANTQQQLTQDDDVAGMLVTDECDCCPAINQWRSPLDQSQFWVRGDYLFWKTIASDLNYVVGSLYNITTPSDIKGAHYDWDSGFRIALGYRFSPQPWEIGADYTYLHNSGHRETENSEGILATFFTLHTAGLLTVAKTDLNLHYNLLNVTLALPYLFNDMITLRPSVAASGAFIHQDWKTFYGAGNLDGHVNIDWKYNAGGIRFACDVDWFFGRGVSLLTHIGFGGYVGPFKHDEKITNNFKQTGEVVLLEDSEQKDTRFAMNARFAIGPTWGISYDSWAFTLFALYELNPWFNLQLYNISDFNSGTGYRRIQPETSVLTPQGLTIGAQVAF